MASFKPTCLHNEVARKAVWLQKKSMVIIICQTRLWKVFYSVEINSRFRFSKSIWHEHLLKFNSISSFCFHDSKTTLSKGIEFCVRMKENWWLSVNSFAQSDALDVEVVFDLSDKDMKEYGDRYPGMEQKLNAGW
jgi:hypothetical protein